MHWCIGEFETFDVNCRSFGQHGGWLDWRVADGATRRLHRSDLRNFDSAGASGCEDSNLSSRSEHGSIERPAQCQHLPGVTADVTAAV
jgi:hypothetical protein